MTILEDFPYDNKMQFWRIFPRTKTWQLWEPCTTAPFSDFGIAFYGPPHTVYCTVRYIILLCEFVGHLEFCS